MNEIHAFTAAEWDQARADLLNVYNATQHRVVDFADFYSELGPIGMTVWDQALATGKAVQDAALQAATDFTDAMNRLITSASVTPDQVERLQAAILDMAAVSGSSPAAAANTLASAFYDTPDAYFQARQATESQAAPITVQEQRAIPFDTHVSIMQTRLGSYVWTWNSADGIRQREAFPESCRS